MASIVAREVQAWRLMAQDLGVEFEAPYVLEHQGKQYEFLVRLPQFGAPRGMLVMLSYDSAASAAASAKSFGFSCVELGVEAERESVIEMLKDWGWTRMGNPPGWYCEA
jgi:hypothetical protein